MVSQQDAQDVYGFTRKQVFVGFTAVNEWSRRYVTRRMAERELRGEKLGSINGWLPEFMTLLVRMWT